MAKVKIEKGPFIFNPESTEEERAEAVKAVEAYFIGAQQSMIGEGRRQLVDAFTALLKSQDPERLEKLEGEIKTLQTMDKPERFRTQFYMLMVDAFQGGMHFALDKRAMDARLDLLKVLGLAPLDQSKKK